MFDSEARWIADRLSAYRPEEISPLLNVGSSTREFREREQPWIADRLLKPLSTCGIEITHLDSRAGEGIDLRADLLNDDDFGEVRLRRYRGLLCCNILEHVLDPGEFARRCAALVMPGGIIVVTVPHSYPRHGDPIDTMYRPMPEEAAALFPGTVTVAGEILDTGESYRDEVHRRPWLLFRHLARLPAPFLGFERWRSSMQKPYWLFHNYLVTVLVLRRE